MNPSNLLPGDVLLYHGTTLVGRIICFLTRSNYCHAAMIGVNGKVLEMFNLSGGKTSEVEEQAAYRIDVYRLHPFIESPARGAAENMAEAIRERYSLWHAILAGACLAFRWIFRPFRKECNRHGLHCSQAVSLAYRQAGLDPWPGGSDWATTPGHLADSPYFRNLGRLKEECRAYDCQTLMRLDDLPGFDGAVSLLKDFTK